MPPSRRIVSDEVCERLDRRSDRFELRGTQGAEARREPDGPLRLDRAEHLQPRGRDVEADATLVAANHLPLDETRSLETRHELRDCRHRDALSRREFAHA